MSEVISDPGSQASQDVQGEVGGNPVGFEATESDAAPPADSNGDGANGDAPAGAEEEPEQFRKLFIGGLSLNTTDESLREFYGQYGAIVDCIVMRDGQTKKSRGFGFVTFNAKSEVDKAMNARPHIIDNKQVDPKRAVPRELSSRGEANVSTNRLYVSGVREEHSEQSFNEHFSRFGAVTKVEIINDKATNKPRGFGFITFEDYDAVDKCVLQKSHMINGFRCDVKKALSRDEMARAQQMERDRQERGARSRGQRNGPGAWGQQQGGGGRGGPAGSFREPHGYNAGPWSQGGGGAWGQPSGGQWGGYGGGYGSGYGGAQTGSWSGAGGADHWNAQSNPAQSAWNQQGYGAQGGSAMGYGQNTQSGGTSGYQGGWSSGRGGAPDRTY